MPDLRLLSARPAERLQGLRVLFVDDERQVLEGLRRMLWPRRHQWNMRFATGTTEALAMLRALPADLLVTDMRMPDRDGVSLLRDVERDWPDTLRYMLTGQAESALLLAAFGSAHQFFAKPCGSGEILAAVERGLALAARLRCFTMPEARISAALRLAPAGSWAELQRSLAEERADPYRLQAQIAALPGLAAKLMQVANSSLFGPPGQVLDLAQAMRHLGMQTCRQVIGAAGMVIPVADEDPRAGALARRGRIARTASEVARQMGRLLGLSAAEVSATESAALFYRIADGIAAGGGPAPPASAAVISAERSPLTATHLSIWGLPDAIADCVAPPCAAVSARQTDGLTARVCRIADAVAGSLEDDGLLPPLDRLRTIAEAASQAGEPTRPARRIPLDMLQAFSGKAGPGHQALVGPGRDCGTPRPLRQRYLGAASSCC